MAGEMCLFPGRQPMHMDSPAEVALSPSIHPHKTESGNLLQGWEHPGHKALVSLQEHQDLLGQTHTKIKCSCQ